MSTKTTFKRVALVAVAALGIGMLSAIPSNAAIGTDSFTTAAGASSASQSGTINTAATLDTVWSGIAGSAGDTATISASITSSPITSNATSVTETNTSGATNVNVRSFTAAGVITADTGTARTTEYATYSFTPDKVGTYVLKLTSANGVNNAYITWTITVAAAAYNHSTAYMATGNATADATTDATTVSTPIVVAATASATPAATLTVRQYASTDTATTVSAGSGTAVVVSISGGGSVGTTSGGTATGPTATVAAGGNGVDNLYVFPNGVAGTATITISVNGTTVATKTVTFAGTLASYKLGTPSKTIIGVGSTGTVKVSGLDSNGNPAILGTLVATSATPTVATVSASTSGNTSTITITGVAAGTSVITVANAASSPTISTTFTVTVGKATIKTLTMSTDATSYATGGKITLTVKALGSDGKAIGDGTYAAFGSAVTGNTSITGTLPAASVAFVGGVATFVIYAPMTAGTVTLSSTEGADTDNVTAGGTAATISTSFDVTDANGSAAVDAANAATDAANYAADAADAATTAAQEATAAAQAAQDSADAATAAVVALGLRVDTLLASVRAQLTSLSNLLVRIIRKTHA